MAKVSIIVPIYNVEKYLAECIESLCSQTLEDIEIILVDDGSPDNSGAICDEYAQKDTRIKVIHKKNAGVSAARNDGLSIATGDYVIFVDSDDYVPVDAYEKMYAKASEEGADVVLADLYQVKGDKEIYAQFFKESFMTDDRQFIDGLIEANFYHTYCPMPPESGPAFGYGGPTTKLVNRNLLKNNNIEFDPSVKGIFDDIIYSAYVFAAAQSVAYITEPVYYYRLLETSITQTYKANMPEINEAIFKSWKVFLDKYDKENKYERMYSANVVRRLEQIVDRYFFSANNPKKHGEIMKELSYTLREEPYKTAVNRVEYKKLIRRHKVLVVFARMKSASLLWMLYGMKRVVKRVLGK